MAAKSTCLSADMSVPLLATGSAGDGDDEVLQRILSMSSSRVRLHCVCHRWLEVCRSRFPPPIAWPPPPASPVHLELEINQAMNKLIFSLTLKLRPAAVSTVAYLDWVPSYFRSSSNRQAARRLRELRDFRTMVQLIRFYTNFRNRTRRALSEMWIESPSRVFRPENADASWCLACRCWGSTRPSTSQCCELRLRSEEGQQSWTLSATEAEAFRALVFESPFGLVEELLADNAWQLLATCVLLNKTGRLAVDRVLPEFLSICPGPHELLATAPDVLHRIFLPLGLHRKRARMLRRFSTEFLEAQKEADGNGNIALERVRRFHGVGKYASDAYEIFILKRVSTVQPTDCYLRWYSSALVRQLREQGYNDLDETFRDCMSQHVARSGVT
eukprot:s1130_g7.t1